MIDRSTVLYEYEEILLGKRLNFKVAFDGPEADRKKAVGYIWEYAITHLLRWTPEQALKYLDNDIVDTLCLNRTFQGLNFDRGHSYIADYRFILQYAFPDRIKYDMRAETIAEYEKSAKLGIWKNDKNEYKLPKAFYTDENGKDRIKIIMKYCLNMFMGDLNVVDRYKFFADPVKGKKWYLKRKLGEPYRTYADTPLEFYHNNIPFKDRDEFLYRALQMKRECDEKLGFVKVRKKKNLFVNKVDNDDEE